MSAEAKPRADIDVRRSYITDTHRETMVYIICTIFTVRSMGSTRDGCAFCSFAGRSNSILLFQTFLDRNNKGLLGTL